MKDVNDLMQAILEMDAAQRKVSEKAKLERTARLAALDEQKQKIIAECDAREKAACEAAAKAAMEHGLHKVAVFVKGPGSGRETAIRSLQAAGLEVSGIQDKTPIPHNGCRPKKRRRV